MLENLPGMAPSAGGPVVIGSGTPVYYVNGREIKDRNELKAIEPSNIKSITIDRLPGVEYGVGTRAVVSIELKKNPNDYIYFNIGTILSQNREFGYGFNFNFRYRYKRFSTSLSFNQGYDNYLLKEGYTRSIYHPDYTTTTTEKRRYSRPSMGYPIRYIAEYWFDNKSFIGFYYNFRHYNADPDITGLNSIESKDYARKWDYTNIGKSINNAHNFTLMYGFFNKKIYLRVTQDAFFTFTPGYATATETGIDGNTSSLSTMTDVFGRYQTYTTNARLTIYKLPWGMTGNTGIRYDRVNSKTGSTVSGDEANYSSSLKVREDNVTSYISLTKRLGKFEIRPQLSYTYTYRNITNETDYSEANIVKQHYSTLTPKIYAQWTPNNDWSVYAQYNRDVTQPGFSALNSGMIYKNQWEWESSNPDLKAQTSNGVTIGASWKALSARISYSDTRNYIVDWQSLMSPDADVVTSYSVNLPKYTSWFFMLAYSGNIGKVNYYANISTNIPHYRMMIQGNEVLRNKPVFNANLNMNYRLNSHFSFTTSYTYSGSGWDVPLVYRKIWHRWDIGIQTSLLKNRLSISLNLRDILKTANYSNNIHWFDNISSTVGGRSDARGVTLSVSYIIFNKKVRTNIQNGNDEIRGRMGYY